MNRLPPNRPRVPCSFSHAAERTLVVWEQHDDFVPVADEPRCLWVDRDDDQIAILVRLAEELLLALRPDDPARSVYRPGALA